MLPGMGGFEAVVIALLALVIVGPKDLPILMRKLARWVNKVRGMAAEFRMSFDELARQSELDELRREVDALRRGEPLAPVRAAIDPVARDINAGFEHREPDHASDPAYEAAVAEANGESQPAAEDPYLPSFEPNAPEHGPGNGPGPEIRIEPAPPPAEPQPEAPAAEPTPAPKRARRKSASVAGGEA